jgi:ParB-like chromosome segregation protein Spo0J
MAMDTAVTTTDLAKVSDDTLLPDTYDQLLPVETLVHGEHNPRREQPSARLRRSIQRHGLDRALIVRPDPEQDIHHITDGWQRYQAATDCGWEALPVRIYDTPLAALEATEVASLGRSWSTYDWAQYYESLASEVEASSQQRVIERVAALTDGARSTVTIRKYLDALSLPVEIHPLLRADNAGSEQEWAALQNHNQDVRQYSGLSWDVAARLARQQDSLNKQRVVAIAATAVEFEMSVAEEFVAEAAARPESPLATIRKEVLYGQQHDRYLEVPRVAVRLDHDEKQAIMEHCHQTRQSLSEIVTERIEALAQDVAENSS